MSNYVMPEVAKIQLYRLLADYCHRYQQILMQLPIAVHQGLHIDQNSSVAG